MLQEMFKKAWNKRKRALCFAQGLLFDSIARFHSWYCLQMKSVFVLGKTGGKVDGHITVII